MFKRLTNYFNNASVKMTKEKYFSMCEQLNKEPKEEEIPPDMEDFPIIAQIAINIFNSLGDRIYPDVGYIGKDYTNLPILIDIYQVDEVELLLEIIQWLDSRAIKASSDRLKKEYDKLKNKTKNGR